MWPFNMLCIILILCVTCLVNKLLQYNTKKRKTKVKEDKRQSQRWKEDSSETKEIFSDVSSTSLRSRANNKNLEMLRLHQLIYIRKIHYWFKIQYYFVMNKINSLTRYSKQIWIKIIFIFLWVLLSNIFLNSYLLIQNNFNELFFIINLWNNLIASMFKKIFILKNVCFTNLSITNSLLVHL